MLYGKFYPLLMEGKQSIVEDHPRLMKDPQSDMGAVECHLQ
jgi:hypothetical protein